MLLASLPTVSRPTSTVGRIAGLILVLVIAGMVVWKPAEPAHAAPSGALTTTEITIGAGVVIYFLKYESALKRIKGSYDQAEATITDMDIARFAYLALPADDCNGVERAPRSSPDPAEYNCTSVRLPPTPFNLRNIRDQLIRAVHNNWETSPANDTPAALKASKISPPWRNYFEDYSGCYNQVMFAQASPSPKASAAAVPSPASSEPIEGSVTDSPVANGKNVTSKPGKPSASGSTSHTSRSTKPRAAGPKTPAPGHVAQRPQASASPAPAGTGSSGTPSVAAGSNQSVSKACNALIADFSAPTVLAAEGSSSVPTHGDMPAIVPSPEPTLDPSALYPIDALNLTQSLASAPSLLQELSDENIGSHVADNVVRIAFLIRTGANLLHEIAPRRYPSILAPNAAGGAPLVLESDYTSVYTNCITASPLSALSCLASASTIEQKLETNRQQKIACDWAKSVVLPTYTMLQLYPPTRKDWGAPAGC